MYKAPFEECPRFLKYSVNYYPLGPAYPNQYINLDDPERKWNLVKAIRIQIAGKKYKIQVVV